MKYQLVLQFRGDTLADYDAMVALKDRLIEDLGQWAKSIAAKTGQRPPS